MDIWQCLVTGWWSSGTGRCLGMLYEILAGPAGVQWLQLETGDDGGGDVCGTGDGIL